MTATTQPWSKLLAATSAVAVAMSVALFTPPASAAAMPVIPAPSVTLGSDITYTATASKPRITTNPTNATISRYGTRTTKTFKVVATGSKLRYKWQYRTASGKTWKTIKAAKSRTYKARSSRWSNGTRFRVIVSNKRGKVISKSAKLKVLHPTKTPAADAAKKFGLSGLTQGVDLSSYQYLPSGRVKMSAIAKWAGSTGFAILRNGSGARPMKQTYTDACTNRTKSTGAKPAVEDCAYPVLADGAKASKLSLGHYWFNGWITSIDTTKAKLFSGSYTPTKSAAQYVAWLKADGNYTKSSTDPLVLDIEAGRAWTKTSNGKSYKVSLRAWKPSEATQFLTTVKSLLTAEGYQSNLYVYMSSNAAKRTSKGTYVWTDVAGIARLWVASWGTNNGRIPDKAPAVGPWSKHGGWSIWQYTCNNRIASDGVGALDSDVAKADAWTPR